MAERRKYLLIDCTSVRTAKKTELVMEYTDSSEKKKGVEASDQITFKRGLPRSDTYVQGF